LGAGLQIELPPGRIYVGQAGASSSHAGIPSASTLLSRIGGNHLGGRVRNSTLRRTLASVLIEPQVLMLIGPKRLTVESEARLTSWMERHLSLAICVVDSGAQLAALEAQVVEALRPPLNIDHVPSGALHQWLLELRTIVTIGKGPFWCAPDPTITDWRGILLTYGQDFDGYGYASAVGRECSAIADEVWRRHKARGHFLSSYAELRCALFWLQRWVHNAEQTPGWQASAKLEERVQQLYSGIGDAWRKEGGVEA
jgi:hypothetical protein